MSSAESLFQLTEEQISQSRIVVVDDDELVTNSLRSFLSLEIDVDPIVFNDSPQAATYIKEHEIDLIISDFLMPEMDGIQLLAEARRLRPHVPRVLLTGYADKENAIKAINEVGLFQYIEKPWDNDDLLIILRNGIERRQLMSKLAEKIHEINSAYGDLQSMHKQILKTFV